MTTRVPRTAAELLAAVAPFGPSVEGDELVFSADPLAELLPLLRVLQTGVRAALTGRPWWGLAAGRGPKMFELRTTARLPPDADLLCVEGDARWDRLPPGVRLDLPALFEPTVAGPSGRAPGPARIGSG